MRPIGVPDEPGVQRLDAIQPLRVEIGGVLSRREPKVRMRARNPDADVLTELRREPLYD
jgi:hypothetical protein